ncbi:MAG: hypothetical protein FJW88_06675 [Actinobacteria bacterium]|nr:hypothetical protein [Actinomycetota bacterium]
MPTPITVRLLPDPDQHDLLAATLERVNKACNAARTRALERKVTGKAELRALVREELERFKLPATFNAPSADRVAASLRGQRFGTYQTLVLPPAALKWPATDRVSLPTSAGKRTVRVYVDPARGSLRPPLEGKPTALVYRNGGFELVDAGSPRG